MKNFEIEFSAHEANYKAKASKIPSVDDLPVEYQVFNIQPEIPKAPKTFMFTYNPPKEKFECTIFNGDVELSKNIFDSIKKYLIENNIPLTT
jgi:hypothetical protein